MFEHLSGLDVAGKTTEVALPEIAPHARLTVKPADETNKPYYNALLKLGADRVRNQMRRGDDLDPEVLKENRAIDVDLFPKYVIDGWSGVLDSNGDEVEYSQANCIELIQAIPGWVFDKVRTAANTQERFVDWTQLEPDTEELVKNSKSGSPTT